MTTSDNNAANQSQPTTPASTPAPAAHAAHAGHGPGCGCGHDHGPAVQRIVNSGGKTGRNDPCPCGSGKKYKKCCSK